MTFLTVRNCASHSLTSLFNGSENISHVVAVTRSKAIIISRCLDWLLEGNEPGCLRGVIWSVPRHHRLRLEGRGIGTDLDAGAADAIGGRFETADMAPSGPSSNSIVLWLDDAFPARARRV